jgi:uncharacterized protein YqhQ
MKRMMTTTRRPDRPPVRVGGQALPDGVVMRTSRAWAVARADGTVQRGSLPPPRMSRIPVLRVLAGLVVGLRVGLGGGQGRHGRGSMRRNWPFLRGLLAAEVAVITLTAAASRLHTPRLLAPLTGVAMCLVALAVFRIVAPSSQWRFHGAEHKAVAAFEAGCDVEDTAAVLTYSRVHPRCGTNLVLWAVLVAPVAQGLPVAGQLLAFPLLLGAVAEVISIASRYPHNLLSRILLAPGMLLQAVVTTAEPSPAEQVIGCRALAACLELHAAVALVPATTTARP